MAPIGNTATSEQLWGLIPIQQALTREEISPQNKFTKNSVWPLEVVEDTQIVHHKNLFSRKLKHVRLGMSTKWQPIANPSAQLLGRV